MVRQSHMWQSDPLNTTSTHLEPHKVITTLATVSVSAHGFGSGRVYSPRAAVGDSTVFPGNPPLAYVLFCLCSKHSILKPGNGKGFKEKNLELIYTQVNMANNINICYSSIIPLPMKCFQRTRAEELPAATAPAAESSVADTAEVACCTGSGSQTIS